MNDLNKLVTVADECVQQIQVVECGEPLIDLQESLHGVILDRSAQNQQHLGYVPDFRLRASVVSRLAKAHAYLPPGHFLLIKECFRPAAVQARYFAKYQEKLRMKHPTIKWMIPACFCRVFHNLRHVFVTVKAAYSDTFLRT